MKAFKKVMAMGLAAMAAVSAMSMTAMAEETMLDTSENLTIVDNMIDYSIYDDDMIYIQEHADKVAEYNATVVNSRSAALSTTYEEWDWDTDGICSCTSNNSSGMILYAYFIPVNNYLYFNAEVTELSKTPFLTVNILNSDNTLTYVGSYNVSSAGSDTYEWNNYKRSLNAGKKYVFALLADTNWGYASMDIYKSAM